MGDSTGSAQTATAGLTSSVEIGPGGQLACARYTNRLRPFASASTNAPSLWNSARTSCRPKGGKLSRSRLSKLPAARASRWIWLQTGAGP